ncbi:TPA: DUF1642 domain-containing protein [Listeria monocytogenes]
MQFKEGDKVQFIREGSMVEGVVKEFKDCSPDMWYLIDDKCKDSWIFEGHLIPLTPLPIIPQFVADWIEYCEKYYWELSEALRPAYKDNHMHREVMDWFEDCRENQELFARAWLDGYEVEKEPLYYVRLPLASWNKRNEVLEDSYRYLLLNITSDETLFNGSLTLYPWSNEKGWRTQLTEKQIKDINEKYWAFAVPVEEVTE